MKITIQGQTLALTYPRYPQSRWSRSNNHLSRVSATDLREQLRSAHVSICTMPILTGLGCGDMG
jgi:hypothetical protein